MKNLPLVFIKNLGKGRAWRNPAGETLDFLNIIGETLEDIKDYFKDLKFTHFTVNYLDENNVLNGEDLFDITLKKPTLAERAEDVDLAWRMLAGNSSYKTLEKHLQRSGFELFIIENTDENTPDLGSGFQYGNTQYGGEIDDKKAQYGGHTGRVIGNGFLNIQGRINDPAQFVNGKHSIYIKGYFDPSDSEWDKIVEIVLRMKPAHVVAVCQIAERKKADNEYYDTTVFVDRIDGGHPDTTDFKEKLNRYREE